MVNFCLRTFIAPRKWIFVTLKQLVKKLSKPSIPWIEYYLYRISAYSEFYVYFMPYLTTTVVFSPLINMLWMIFLNSSYQVSFIPLSSLVFAFVPCCCTCCVFTSSAYRFCFIASRSLCNKPAGIWMRSGWQGMHSWLICSAWGYDENSHLYVYMNTVMSVQGRSVVVYEVC